MASNFMMLNSYANLKSRCTTLRHMDEVDMKFYEFLTSTLGSGEWSASRSGRFTAG